MYDDYYITHKDKEPIYFSIITLNNSYEISLYIGKSLVRRKSLQRGLHVIEKDNVKLKIQLKLIKALPELYINSEKVEIEKIKRKALSLALSELNIYNELNPKKLAKTPYDYKKLIVPGILIVIGAICQLTIGAYGKFWEVPAMLFFLIAYYQISAPLLNKISERVMDQETKGKFKLIVAFAFMILTQILISDFIK